MRAITADPVLRRYLPCSRWCCGGGRNPHGEEVLWRDLFNFFGTVESGMFCTDTRCNTSVVQLNWYIFLTWIFGRGSFFQDQKFLNGLAIVRCPMAMFHVEGRVQSVFFVRDSCAICIIRARSVLLVRGLLCFPRAIVYLFMRELSAIHVFLMHVVRTLFL